MAVLIWDGLDIPRVGVICEYRSRDNCGPKDWTVVHVLACGDHGGDKALLLAEDECGRPAKMFGRIWQEGCFRPLRTPEQIAAEEREAAIADMTRVISSKVADRRAAESLYELGYRKVKQP